MSEPTLVSRSRLEDGSFVLIFEREEVASRTFTTITLQFLGAKVTMIVSDTWETKTVYDNIYAFHKNVIRVDSMEDEDDVFEERGMYVRFLSRITDVLEDRYGNIIPLHGVDIELCNYVADVVHGYILYYRDASVTKVQAIVRGWLSRRRFNIAKMRVVNEMSVLPAGYVSPSFPGGSSYRIALARWRD